MRKEGKVTANVAINIQGDFLQNVNAYILQTGYSDIMRKSAAALEKECDKDIEFTQSLYKKGLNTAEQVNAARLEKDRRIEKAMATIEELSIPTWIPSQAFVNACAAIRRQDADALAKYLQCKCETAQHIIALCPLTKKGTAGSRIHDEWIRWTADKDVMIFLINIGADRLYSLYGADNVGNRLFDYANFFETSKSEKLAWKRLKPFDECVALIKKQLSPSMTDEEKTAVKKKATTKKATAEK